MKKRTGSSPQTYSNVPSRSQHGQQPQMTMGTVCDVLQERGYEMVPRFGHVHARKDGSEWHICLIADVVALSRLHLLAHLEDALAHSFAQ